MRLHVLYRISALGNSKVRPDFFSKRVALDSFVAALSRIDVVGEVQFLCDGPVPDEWIDAMRAVGPTVQLPGLGNSGSYRRALDMFREATRWHDDDLVYFAEDDYLYREEAFRELSAAARALPMASFFTPYDHPDYEVGPHVKFREHHPKEQWRVGDHEWRSVRGTTMTFAARVAPMRRFLPVHELGARAEHPEDWEIWSALLTLSPRFLLAKAVGYADVLRTRAIVRRWPEWIRRDHLLVAPRPSLATHLETPFLARGTDWRSLAEELDARREP